MASVAYVMGLLGGLLIFFGWLFVKKVGSIQIDLTDSPEMYRFVIDKNWDTVKRSKVVVFTVNSKAQLRDEINNFRDSRDFED